MPGQLTEEEFFGLPRSGGSQMPKEKSVSVLIVICVARFGLIDRSQFVSGSFDAADLKRAPGTHIRTAGIGTATMCVIGQQLTSDHPSQSQFTGRREPGTGTSVVEKRRESLF
jgi:hypothetical protein